MSGAYETSCKYTSRVAISTWDIWLALGTATKKCEYIIGSSRDDVVESLETKKTMTRRKLWRSPRNYVWIVFRPGVDVLL